ncbi:MAG: small, acid-soluble spore protein, alpha/beta type [Bacillota bacterium]
MSAKKPLSEAEKNKIIMKYEIAEELGLTDKVMKLGWKGLTAKETGKIGGIMGKRQKELQKKE